MSTTRNILIPPYHGPLGNGEAVTVAYRLLRSLI